MRSFFIRNQDAWAKIIAFLMGLSLKKGSDYIFDYIMYPLALLQFGYLAGGMMMTAASIGLNLFAIRLYDFCKTDAFFIEALKDIQAGRSLPKYLRIVVKRGKVAIFFVLCAIEDPFVVTLYFREGCSQFNGMSTQDWRNFACSTVVSNLLWSSSLGLVFEFVLLLRIYAET